MRSIIQGGTFTFVVGHEKTPFIVHKKAIEQQSDILGTLVNSGATQESTADVTHLQETEPEAFALFAEFAYTGYYRIVKPPTSQYWRTGAHKVLCYQCRDRHVIPSARGDIPKQCLTCGSEHIVIGNINRETIIWDLPTDEKARQQSSVESETPAYFSTFEKGTNLNSDCSLPALAFKKRSYPALGKGHATLRRYITALQPPDLSSQKVCTHARLFVFAQKYAVPALAQLCLHKLHRDLIYFYVDEDGVEEMAELLVYTYKNTADDKNGDAVNEASHTARSVRDYYGKDLVEDSDDSYCDDSSSDEYECEYVDSGVHEDEVGKDSSDGNSVSGQSDQLSAQDSDEIKSAKSEIDHDDADTISEAASEKGKGSGDDASHTVATPIGSLRGLVMGYAIANAPELMKYSAFNVIFEYGGDLVNDFMRGVAGRLDQCAF